MSLYTLSVNAFADLTTEEFVATHTGSRPLSRSRSASTGLISTGFKYKNISDVPPSMDWRDKGAVTPVKNQRNCGCCWAFSAVAAVESLHQIKTRNLISLSEQELNDCDTNNSGCKGGNAIEAFMFIQKNQGILTENQYPYKGVDDQCEALQGDRVTIDGFETVPDSEENALLQAVFRQPVVVHVDSGGIHFYKSGIFNGECGTNINHDLTIIGFGTDDDGNNFWLAKNSWGTDWGEKGFIRMIRDKNICGLVIQPPVYPV
ncbi:hypothetical protein BVRB_1g021250 [Beta vulgaris subsp. vulgaris]|uniref:ervatamin-C n=1 Tax=Beta vulgaris subsp. vulgaris TaxID=3555 RepID=UPI00065C3CFB|nr:ervatamin-C [Beta vulgaris subsp. vulgaris]KMS99762.1 hypothetical protein BVRB_1g021250 [Beta vulgaris subsp. vulgaris]